MIKILSPRTSQSAIALANETGIARTHNGRNRREQVGPDGANLLVNWGLAGTALAAYYRRWPDAAQIPTLNRDYPGNKYRVNQMLRNESIPVPDSRGHISQPVDGESWLYKPYYSRGGHGIRRLTSQDDIDNANWTNGYAQKEVENRRYEVRVSAFNWLPREQWGIWKKTNEHPENLTWNHEQGGKFETVQSRTAPLFVRCMEWVEKIMHIFQLQFCAVDFIVDQDWHEMVLEINMRPGFDELGKPVYVNALNVLNGMSLDEQVALLVPKPLVEETDDGDGDDAVVYDNHVEPELGAHGGYNLGSVEMEGQSPFADAVRAALEGFLRAGMTRRELVNIANNL
jgi:hypothetical protein